MCGKEHMGGFVVTEQLTLLDAYIRDGMMHVKYQRAKAFEEDLRANRVFKVVQL